MSVASRIRWSGGSFVAGNQRSSSFNVRVGQERSFLDPEFIVHVEEIGGVRARHSFFRMRARERQLIEYRLVAAEEREVLNFLNDICEKIAYIEQNYSNLPQNPGYKGLIV